MNSNRIFSIFQRGSTSRQFFRDFTRYTIATIPWIAGVILFNNNVGEVTTINGVSMYPYLNTSFNEGLSKDTCWVNKWNPHKGIHRGMIVSFWSPNHPDVMAIKRVVALEGDRVYTRAPCPSPTVQIPKNHVWVEGDNKDGRKTLDSNHYGPIPLSLITGQVTHILSPWKSSGAIRWWDYKGSSRVMKGRMEDAPNWN